MNCWVSRILQSWGTGWHWVAFTVLVLKNLKVSNTINSSFPTKFSVINLLNITQKNIFELEIWFLCNEWFLVYPLMSSSPLKKHFDGSPSAKLLGRTDDANFLTKLGRILNLEFDCVRLVHETLWSMIFHIQSRFLTFESQITLTSSVHWHWLALQIIVEIWWVLILNLQVLNINDLLGRFVEKGVRSIWIGCMWLYFWLLDWIQ